MTRTAAPGHSGPVGHHRQQLRLTGVVQGVGFRPFVHRLAHDLRLAGRVGNDATGVFVEVEGDGALLDRFAERLVAEHPPLARIDAIDVREVAARHEFGFSIAESSRGPVDGVPTLVPPDVATCDDCLDEVDGPSDRR